MNVKFLADMGERAARSFIQGFFGLWLANPNAPVDFDTLFTVDNLKAGVVMAVLSIAMAVGSKGVGDRNSASVLVPAPAQPAVEPQPATAPTVNRAPVVFPAALFSARTDRWEVVHIRPDMGGRFRLLDRFHQGLPVVDYLPEGGGTHSPVGPTEQSHMGLRPDVPHPDAEGN